MKNRGDRVRLVRVPPWVAKLPEESRRVFEFCVGREFRVVEVDESRGVLVLDVSAEVDQRFGGRMNDIRVEREFVESCG